MDGEGDTATITAGQVQALDDFLIGVSAAGSPALQQAIAGERAPLGNLADYVGTTMEQARGIVVGYVVYLPVLMQS